jgi:hypothetical protein
MSETYSTWWMVWQRCADRYAHQCADGILARGWTPAHARKERARLLKGAHRSARQMHRARDRMFEAMQAQTAQLSARRQARG